MDRRAARPGEAAVVGGDLTAVSGAPLAESDPVLFHHPATNTMHVVYRGPHGHLFEMRWVMNGVAAFFDLSLAALAPRAVGRPAALTQELDRLRAEDDRVRAEVERELAEATRKP